MIKPNVSLTSGFHRTAMSADEIAASLVKTSREIDRETLDRDVAAFLKKGGKVETLKSCGDGTGPGRAYGYGGGNQRHF